MACEDTFIVPKIYCCPFPEKPDSLFRPDNLPASRARTGQDGGDMTIIVKFRQSGQFNSGEFKSLDLDKITKLKINHLRNSAELAADTPENPRPNTPYIIAERENAYELQTIVDELDQLSRAKKSGVYEITETEAHLLPP
jgi:hypothetical protein